MTAREARLRVAHAQFVGLGEWDLDIDGEHQGRMAMREACALVERLSDGKVRAADWSYGIMHNTCTWQEEAS